MHAVTHKEDKVIVRCGKGSQNTRKILKISIQSRGNNQGNNNRGRGEEEPGILPVIKEEVKKSLESTRRENVTCENQVTAELLTDGEYIVLEKLAN